MSLEGTESKENVKRNLQYNIGGRTIIIALVSLMLLLTVVFSACTTSSGPPSTPPVSPEEGNIRTVNAYEARFLVEKFEGDEDFTILDIRRIDESAEPFLEGAVVYIYHSEEFIEELDSLDKEQNYLVYGSKTIPAGNIQQLFRFLDFKKVYFLNDGVAAWRTAGYPVVYPGSGGNVSPENPLDNESGSGFA